MSYAEQFVLSNNLRPADAILLRKKFMGMFDHFAIYLGRHRHSNKPMFAANYTGGVQILEEHEAAEFLEKLDPEKIERFTGSERARSGAIDRAWQWVNKKGYHLIFNNCEHYKNFVQFGKKYSRQVDVAGKSAMVIGGATAVAGLASRNKKAVLGGLFLLALGGIASAAADRD
ncbi:MAG: C40 family peptidase [Bacteroidetes bacterium]|nr:C40 family peptidase [Bacteroidota bacterium]